VRELFICFFGGYISLVLCVYAIGKKALKTKRKTLFDLRFFYLSRGGKRRGRKSNTLTRQTVIYLMRVLPGRKSITFCKQGKDTPLLQKTISEI